MIHYNWSSFSSVLISSFLPSSADCKGHAGNEKQAYEDNQTTGKCQKRKTGNYSGAWISLCHIISQSETDGIIE